MRADVAVIGAGLAGLVAASELQRAGADVRVLEAADRVGGRVHGVEILPGAAVELGAQWIGPGQERMYELAERLGVETFPTHTRGRNLLELGGGIKRYRGTIPPLGPIALVDVALARWRLARAARRVPLDDPASAPGADELASRSFAWLSERMVRTRRARALLGVAGRTVWGAEPSEMSALHVLHYVHAAGGLDPLLDTEGGAQQDRLVGGTQRLVDGLSAELGDALVTGAPAHAVRAERAGVRVELAADRVDARRAVVAVPPVRLAALGLAEETGASAWRAGRLIKYAIAWPEPFWRARGLSGEALSERGPATLTFDASPPSGSPGVMVAFVGGADADSFAALAEAERREAVLSGLERIFGAEARRPEAFMERDWPAEPWIGVGPNCHRPPGPSAGHSPRLDLHDPPVHLAGTEYAGAWAGFMEGAVRSGRRAARAALAELG